MHYFHCFRIFLISAKIDNEEAERKPLIAYKQIFLKYSDHCFYCNNHLRSDHIHVDHFIPWSYILMIMLGI